MSSLNIRTVLEEPQPDGGDYEGYGSKESPKLSRYTPLDLTSRIIPEEISGENDEN